MELRIIEDIAVYDKFVLNSPYVHYTKPVCGLIPKKWNIIKPIILVFILIMN